MDSPSSAEPLICRLDDGGIVGAVRADDGIYVTVDDDVVAGPIEESLARVRVAIPLPDRGELGLRLSYDGHIDLDLDRAPLLPVGKKNRRAALDRAAASARPAKRQRTSAPRFFRPRRLIPAGIAVVLGIVGAVGNIGTSDPRDLAAGDCFGDIDATGSVGTVKVSDVRKQACNEPHEAEVFAIIVTDGDGPGPGSLEGDAAITSLCDNALTSMVLAGTIDLERYPLDTSMGWIALSTLRSADGDREVICFLESMSLLPPK